MDQSFSLSERQTRDVVIIERNRWARSTLAMVARLVVALLVFVCATTAHAQSVRIKVRGTAKIGARAARDQGDLVLSGTLTDDAGKPLSGETVTVRVSRESDARDPKVAEGMRGARACDRGADRGSPTAYAVRVGGPPDSPDVLLVTDEGGRFCFRSHPPLVDRYRAHLSWRGTSLVDAADFDLAFDPSRQALVLRFDPTPRILSLDDPTRTFEALALVDEESTTVAAPSLELTLVNEKQTKLATAVTDGAGRARFVVPSAKLGPPGLGELRVSFAGNKDVAFATHATDVERRAKVTLRVPAIETKEQKPANPEEGLPLVVDVASIAGPVSEGGVEARLGTTLVGAAPVERGIARLALTFTATGNEATISLRYVPSAPWYEGLGDTVVRVPVKGPSLLTKLPILVAGLAVLAFFLVGRASGRQAKPAPEPDDGDSPIRVKAEPRLEVVRSAARGELGWKGRVTDAHEGTPIANARVWVERGSFDGRTVLLDTTTDPRGRFVLSGIERVVGDEEMAIEAPLHARLTQKLPPPGELSIALVLRKRAALARLVAWAKRAGGPFDVKPEATPGHVRKAAGPDFRTARWADAVERAVFSGGEVDARAEQELDRLEPEPNRGGDVDPGPRAPMKRD